MGRNTWESIPKGFRPLKDKLIWCYHRKNFIDSENVDYIGNSFENILDFINLEIKNGNINELSNIFIIG